MLDAHGRRILWGWVTESRPEAEFVRAGWAGVMALPRILNVSADGELTMTVPSAFNQLIGPPQACIPAATLPALAGKITATLTPGSGFKLSSGSAVLATLQASTDGHQLTVNSTTLDLHPNESLTLFVDGSVFELFLGTRAAHTFRAYPQLPSKPTLTITPLGSPTDLVAFPVAAISRDRLTT